MKKNDLIKTENGIFRIISIEANRVLAIDCIKKTMPKFYSVSFFSSGELIDRIPADFSDMEDLSPAHRKVAQERYTMIASAVSVVDDIPKRNMMIEKSAEQFGMSKQSIRSFLCSYLVYQDIAVLSFRQRTNPERRTHCPGTLYHDCWSAAIHRKRAEAQPNDRLPGRTPIKADNTEVPLLVFGVPGY